MGGHSVLRLIKTEQRQQADGMLSFAAFKKRQIIVISQGQKDNAITREQMYHRVSD